MSTLDTLPELKELVDKIEELSEEATPYILYHLFDGDNTSGVIEKEDGISWIDNAIMVDNISGTLGYKHIKSVGCGEYCYGIIKVKDRYYKAEWLYYPYSGCEYDCIEGTLKEVKPVEKVITVYE